MWDRKHSTKDSAEMKTSVLCLGKHTQPNTAGVWRVRWSTVKTSYRPANKGLFQSLDFTLGVIGSHWDFFLNNN